MTPTHQLKPEQRESLLAASRAWIQVVAELAPLYALVDGLLALVHGLCPEPPATSAAGALLARRTLATQRELNDLCRVIITTPLSSPLPASVMELMGVLKAKRVQLGRACLVVSSELSETPGLAAGIVAQAVCGAHGTIGATALIRRDVRGLPPLAELERIEAVARARVAKTMA